MSINIVASQNFENCNKHIFSLLKERDKTKNHIIIAPDRSQFSIEQRLFEETGEKCFFDINVISLSRLAKKVIKGSKRKILSKQSGVALVKKIIEKNKDKLLAFGKSSSYIGFASAIFETICFYKSCNLQPKDVYVDNSHTLSNHKQKDIKLIYEEYEKYLQEDYTDSFNQLGVFAQSITKETFPNTIFYFIEFDDFTKLMYEIIAKLSACCENVYITCLFSKGNNNDYLYNNKVYYDLVDLGKYNNLDYNLVKLSNWDCENRRLFASNILAFNQDNIDTSSLALNLREFECIKDEIKYTIADIYRKWTTGNHSLSDFAIITANLTEYKQTLIEELNKYDIPYYLDQSISLRDYSLVRLMFGIFTIITGNYRLSDFEVVLKSPLINFDITAVDEYDSYLKRVGAIGDMCLREGKTDNAEIKQFILLIKQWREKSIVTKTYDGCIQLVQDVIDYILVRIETYTLSYNDLENRTYLQVVAKLDNINKDVQAVFNGVDTDFEEFVEVYSQYFESTNISLPPITSNTIFIADFEVSYISKYKFMYILGNNDGKLPSQKLDNGILTDDEMSRLPNAKLLTPTISMLNQRKVLKLIELLFRYQDSIYLSFVNGGKEGKCYPNNIITSLSAMGVNIEKLSPCIDSVSYNYYDMNIDNVVFNNQTQKVTDYNLLSYLNNWDMYNSNINYREICSGLFERASVNVQQLISNKNNTTINNLSHHNFFGNKTTSVSEIETFYRCPYVHYVRYGLKLQETNSSKINAGDIGVIIHQVLSEIVRYIIKNKEDIDNIKQYAKSKLDKVLSDDKYAELVENSKNTYVIKALYKELDRIVDAVTHQIVSSNFCPQYYEFKFNNILNVEGVDIKGFIDRVDIKDNKFLIIDYKTGDNHFSNYNDVVSGKKLQLLVYARAFELQHGLNPGGVFYFPISNDFSGENKYRFNGVVLKDESNIIDIDTNLITDGYSSNIVNIQRSNNGSFANMPYYKTMCIDKEDFDYLIDFAIKQVEVAVKRIINGEILPYPMFDGNKLACEYCDFKAMCQFDGKNINHSQTVKTIEELKELDNSDGGIHS